MYIESFYIDMSDYCMMCGVISDYKFVSKNNNFLRNYYLCAPCADEIQQSFTAFLGRDRIF